MTIAILQPFNVTLRCTFCQGPVFETVFEDHIRTDHKINHDRAVEMLIALQYSEPSDINSQHQEPTGNDLSLPAEEQINILALSAEEQIPVNEQSNEDRNEGYVYQLNL